MMLFSPHVGPPSPIEAVQRLARSDASGPQQRALLRDMRSYPHSRQDLSIFWRELSSGWPGDALNWSLRYAPPGIRRKLMKLRSALLAFAVAAVLGSTETLAQNAYITNNDLGTVSVIDTTKDAVIATIPVGWGPFGVAVSPDGRKVYIGNWGYTVPVIDTRTNEVVATVATTGNALGIAVSEDGHRVYSTNFYDQSLSVIDTATNTVIATAPAGPGPYGVI